MDITILIGIYYLAQIIKGLTIRINRPIFLIILSGFGIAFLVTFARGFTRNLWDGNMHASLLFLYSEIITISIIIEIAFAKIKHLPFSNYLSLWISPLGQIGKAAFFGFSIFIFFGLHAENAKSDGQLEGCIKTAISPTSAIWYSNDAVAVEGLSKTDDDSYIFTGYYFLLSDSENYYFFRELDPVSLKPQNITIVKKDVLTAITLERAAIPDEWNLTKKCSDLYTNLVK